MQRRYSRLTRIEEKENIRRAVFFSLLTIISLALVFFLGLPAVAKFSAFLSDLRKSSEPVERQDSTPPVPPRIEPLPEATNQLRVDIKGSTEPGVSVILKLNNKEEEILANNDGEFNYTFALNDGENKISAYARDSSGNESQKTEEINIIYDNDPPQLSLTTPNDGTNYYGSKQRQVLLEGETEVGVNININGRFVQVDSDGKFTFTTTLNEGENKFTILAQDLAENITEKTLTLHFSL